MPTLLRPVASTPGVTAQRVVPAAASPLTPSAIRWGDGVVLDAGPLACYLGFPSQAPGQESVHRILPLLRPQALQLPNGWRVATAEPWPVVPGDTVRLDATGLAMGSWRVVPVRHWRPSAVARIAAADPGAAARRLAENSAPPRRADAALAVGLDLYAGAVAVVAVDPWASGATAELDAAVAALLGLGPGSTPSGDDVLCGIALTLRLLGEGDRLDALTATVRPRLGATNDLSAQLLDAALLGYAVPQVVDLLRLLGRPTRARQASRGDRDRRGDSQGDSQGDSRGDSRDYLTTLAGAVDQVRRIGHSSGTDILTGIHATCAALSPP